MTPDHPAPVPPGNTPAGNAQTVDSQPGNAPAGNAAAVNVAAYWGGGFTLRPAPPGPEEEPDEPSLRRLGRSGVTVRGRDLATLLAPAYEAFRG
ncbi:hypothetical protein ACFVTF_02945 [Kitasatospora sp. NPDC057940]|uniref:hypothetical protein n=1 Tax=Kitasatospora sp. NPDC057940 TaxID=3346285 RepID=UPI0036DB26BE